MKRKKDSIEKIGFEFTDEDFNTSNVELTEEQKKKQKDKNQESLKSLSENYDINEENNNSKNLNDSNKDNNQKKLDDNLSFSDINIPQISELEIEDISYNKNEISTTQETKKESIVITEHSIKDKEKKELSNNYGIKNVEEKTQVINKETKVENKIEEKKKNQKTTLNSDLISQAENIGQNIPKNIVVQNNIDTPQSVPINNFIVNTDKNQSNSR